MHDFHQLAVAVPIQGTPVTTGSCIASPSRAVRLISFWRRIIMPCEQWNDPPGEASGHVVMMRLLLPPFHETAFKIFRPALCPRHDRSASPDTGLKYKERAGLVGGWSRLV